MEDYLNDIEGAEVQEPAEPEAVNEETADIEDAGAEDQEVADPETEKTGRTEADAAFAEMRRRAEQAERMSAQERARTERMTEILERLGFRGRNADDVADEAIAHIEQTTPEEVRKQRMSSEYETAQRQAMIDEINALRAAEAQRTVDEDMRVFKKIDPSLKSVADLENKYPAFLKAVSGLADADKVNPEIRELLFRAEYERQSARAVKAPPKVGKVNAKTSVDKDYYTNSELDNLTGKDLDNPEVLEKAIKSLTKLK